MVNEPRGGRLRPELAARHRTRHVCIRNVAPHAPERRAEPLGLLAREERQKDRVHRPGSEERRCETGGGALFGHLGPERGLGGGVGTAAKGLWATAALSGRALLGQLTQHVRQRARVALGDAQAQCRVQAREGLGGHAEGAAELARAGQHQGGRGRPGQCAPSARIALEPRVAQPPKVGVGVTRLKGAAQLFLRRHPHPARFGVLGGRVRRVAQPGALQLVIRQGQIAV